jgi:hypothetical protein
MNGHETILGKSDAMDQHQQEWAEDLAKFREARIEKSKAAAAKARVVLEGINRDNLQNDIAIRKEHREIFHAPETTSTPVVEERRQPANQETERTERWHAFIDQRCHVLLREHTRRYTAAIAKRVHKTIDQRTNAMLREFTPVFAKAEARNAHAAINKAITKLRAELRTEIAEEIRQLRDLVEAMERQSELDRQANLANVLLLCSALTARREIIHDAQGRPVATEVVRDDT